MKKLIFIILLIFAIMSVNAQINIDGNNSDWASVPAIATESSGMTALKVFEDANNLYFYVEGTIGTNTDFYIDADNDATTGYTANQGYDFLFENGTLFQYSGDGSSWDWTDVTTADVKWEGTSSFIENKAPKSIIDIFNGELKILSVTMDDNWTELSKIPASGTPALYTTPATLSVSPSTLSDYTYTEGTGPSNSKSFTLSGTNLDGSAVSVSAPTDYEVSLDNSSFSTSVSVNYSGSTLANTTVSVRLKAGLSAGTYDNELVTCNDNGTASDVSVTNNGIITSDCSYYVSTTGDDTNAGTLASPFKTIQKALDVVSPACTIYVEAGTYSTGTIWLDNKHGSAGNIIKIRNYDSDIAIIDGSNLSGDLDLFYLENTSYITIEGLILENNQQNNASGFNIQGNCQNISIKNCEIRKINFSSDVSATGTSNKNAYPLIVYANQDTANSNIIITNNKIHDCRTSWSEGLAINGNVDGFEVSNNQVYNITNIGIDAIGNEGTAPSNDYARNGVIKNNIVHDCPSPNADCGGIYVDGGHDIIIENNTAYNNQYGIEIGNEHSGTTTQSITVRNNLFYDNTLVGIKIGGYNGDVSNCSVTGNTCYSNTLDDWRGELELSDKLTNTTITNNIFYSTNSQNTIVVADGSSEPSGLILNYNIFYHSNGSSSSDNFDWYGSNHDGNFSKYTGTGHGANSQFIDPLFVANGSDYHLQSTSPAVNAGDPNYTSVAATYSIASDEDMDEQARVQNSTIDCGTDEYSTAPPATLSVSPSTLSDYTYTEGTGPSSSQSFTLSGTNLDGSQVIVSAPTNYEISSDNSTFTTSLNVNYSNSTLANTTIYIRLKVGLSAGTYNNELVTCNDNGTAPGVSVTNNGTVTNSCSYYVSTTGDDANAGTLASPFKTIQKALDVVSPACTIYVRDGTYKEHLSWGTTGTDGNIITLQNYNNEKVYLDGASGGTNDNENVMFTLSNMSYITIDGLIIHNNIRAYAEGIYYNGAGTDITIRNCEFYDISWTSDANAMPTSDDNAHAMVFVGSQATSINNVTIENCHIHNCITGYSEGLTMVGNVEYFTIINNTVNDITNIGIDLAGYWSWTGAPDSVNYARNGLVKGNNIYNCISPVATSAGIYCDGSQYITIENNIVYGNPVGIDIGMENNDTITGSVARNNLVYHNTESGIFFGAYASGGLLTNSIIEGNTLYNNDMGHAMGDWTGEIYLNKTKDCKIINNIIYPRDATNKKAIIMPAKTTTNLTVDYNLYWRATAGVSDIHDISTDHNTYTLDTHKVEADPQFVANGSDFHIQNTSPALNAGDPSYVSFASTHPLATDVDIDGQTRVYGDSIDIGCDEVVTAIVWTGLDATSPTDWNAVNNWSGNNLPISTDNVIIPTDPASNPDRFPELNSNTNNIAELNNLEIQASAHLNIPAGKGLTVNSDFVNNGELRLLSLNDNSPSGSFIVLGNNSGSGTVQIDRYLSINETWQYVSTPLNNTQSDLFTNATANFNPNFLRYNETYDCSPDPTSTDYSNWTSTNLVNAWENNHNGNGGAKENLVQGKGYAYLNNANLKLSFIGNTSNLNNGSISVPVTFTTNDANSNYFDGWNFVGNPFQAALDWNSSDIDKTNINNTIYYYDGDATPPQYRYYNGSGGTETGDGSNVIDGGSQYIPAMQGFFVKAISNGNLVMSNTALAHSSQPLWKNQVVSLNFDYIKLEITDGINTDETVIRFNENATNKFDGKYDAYKMFINHKTPYIFSINNDIPLAINSLKSISNKLTISLSVISPKAGNYSINLIGNNILTQNVYLKDNLNINEPVYINLSKNSTYSFYSPQKEVNNRFEIIFSKAGDIDKISTECNIYSVKNRVYITRNSNEYSFIEIYDLSGKLIYKQNLNSVNTEFTLNVVQGIYLVKIYNNKSITMKKILILK